MSKTCTKCKESKEFYLFPKQKGGKDGLRSTCKSCHNSLKMLWEKNNKNKLRQYWYKRDFGITLDTYNHLALKQNNLCAICNGPNNDKRNRHLHVDHCHITGKIRGLLCQKCNMGLGLFNDNIDLIRKVVLYLDNL